MHSGRVGILVRRELLVREEYNATDFFLIFVAIVFGGQAAGFLFGFTLSQSFLMRFFFLSPSNLARYYQSPCGGKSDTRPSETRTPNQQFHWHGDALACSLRKRYPGNRIPRRALFLPNPS